MSLGPYKGSFFSLPTSIPVSQGLGPAGEESGSALPCFLHGVSLSLFFAGFHALAALGIRRQDSQDVRNSQQILVSETAVGCYCTWPRLMSKKGGGRVGAAWESQACNAVYIHLHLDTAQSQTSRCKPLRMRWLPDRASLDAVSLQVAGSSLSAQMRATQTSRPGDIFLELCSEGEKNVLEQSM